MEAPEALQQLILILVVLRILLLINGANFQIGGSISIFSGSISRAVVQGGTIWGAGIGLSIRNPISVGGYMQSRHSMTNPLDPYNSYIPPALPWQKGKV